MDFCTQTGAASRSKRLNFPIGISIGDKFKLLREKEGLSQRAFCTIVDMSPSTLANIESGRNKSVSVDVLAQVVKHPRFSKYSIWLLVDELTEDQAAEALEFAKSLSTSDQ
jgi:transcriptional regulator with XRE-family HTH domain